LTPDPLHDKIVTQSKAVLRQLAHVLPHINT
jgi:hypothetical protein